MESEQIKISIIVPVYNVESYIRDCLNSLVSQTYKNIEIIIVDDGSKDLSGVICDKYAEEDARITVIHKENGGVVSARKAGIMLATGDYATYVDSDDWVEINAYEELVNVLKVYHPDVITFGFKKEYANFCIERKETLKRGFYYKKQFMQNAKKSISTNHFFSPAVNVTLWSKMFRTDLIKRYQLEVEDEIRVGDDMAVIFPCILGVNNLFVEERCFYHYRVRKDSINWTKKDDEYQGYLKLVKCLRDAKNKFWGWNDVCEKYYIQILYLYLILCAPERCFNAASGFILYPEIKKDTNIIVYGKGVFACNFINISKQKQYCNIVDCVDRTDVERIRQIQKESYEYIVIAITEYSAVQSSLQLLESVGVDMSKVLYIRKKDLVADNLPMEIQSMLH